MLTSIAILDSGARAVSAPRNDLTGRRFGLLTVTGYAGKRGARHYWRVVCDCGAEKECSGKSLLYAGVGSCGCARKVNTGGRRKVAVTDAQREWLGMHFRDTRNKDIMERFGWSHGFLHRLAREMGLAKTAEFTRRCRAAAAEAARESHVIHGTYPPKGYVIPGSEAHRFRPGETCLQRLGAEGDRMRLERAAETMRALRREERARRTFGVPQRTRLRVRRRPRRFYTGTWYLRSRGYEVDTESLVAYYDGNTRRCRVLERMGRDPGRGHYFDFKEKGT